VAVDSERSDARPVRRAEVASVAMSTNEARRAESTHVLYEIEMFCALAWYFETGEVDRAVQGLELEGIVVRNAVIEAFQLHARQLIEFLTRGTPGRSRASHFTWGAWKLPQMPEHTRNFERFSERVMHLSLKRATFAPEDQRVETRRIRRELGDDLAKFLAAVKEDTVCDGFTARARAALLVSEPPPDVLQPFAPIGATEPVVPYGGGTIIVMPDEPSP
jgi:hypothetical protein